MAAVAGLGRINAGAPGTCVAENYGVLRFTVVGAGPSGLAAAIAAAEAG